MERVVDTLSGQAGLLGALMTAAIEADLDAAGLTLAAFELLGAVQASGKRSSQIVVARRLGISAPSLSEAVQGAVRKGLLTQSVSADDARVKTIALTSKGKRSMDRVLGAVGRVESAMRTGLDPGEIDAAVDLLRRVNGNLARMLRSPKE